MKYEKVTLDGFTIVGISVRTTNNEGKAQADIGSLWAKFFSDTILQSIPNRISDDIYCMYTDYENDFMGEYTTIVGCKVSSIDNVSKNLTIKEIPNYNYYKFVAEGKILEAVGKTWQYIWQSDIERKYIADFDIYGKEANDPENAKVITYLSI